MDGDVARVVRGPDRAAMFGSSLCAPFLSWKRSFAVTFGGEALVAPGTHGGRVPPLCHGSCFRGSGARSKICLGTGSRLPKTRPAMPGATLVVGPLTTDIAVI